MADAIGVSSSYFTLLERNQRPLSASVLLRLSNRFDFDARHFAGEEPGGGLDAMVARLRDPTHADLSIDRTEVEDWLLAAPGTAVAFARLHDRTPGVASTVERPDIAARAAIDRWQNHFPDLDAQAEALADELRLTSGDVGHALTDRLRARHQLAIRILPADVLPGALQRLDLHARQLQLSELLGPANRLLALALQLARFECADEVEAIVTGAELTDRMAQRHLRRTLLGWAAAAILLPYGRFLRACEGTGYDVDRLQRRFAVGFDVVAHRLTSLGRVGARGLPFALVRLDRAGQISQRVVGASGLPADGFRAGCPLWSAFGAASRAGETIHDRVEMPEGDRWLTAARSIPAPASGADGLTARFTIAVVLAERFGDALGPSWTLPPLATPIGPGCPTCPRVGCPQRAVPSPLLEGEELAPLGLA